MPHIGPHRGQIHDCMAAHHLLKVYGAFRLLDGLTMVIPAGLAYGSAPRTRLSSTSCVICWHPCQSCGRETCPQQYLCTSRTTRCPLQACRRCPVHWGLWSHLHHLKLALKLVWFRAFTQHLFLCQACQQSSGILATPSVTPSRDQCTGMAECCRLKLSESAVSQLVSCSRERQLNPCMRQHDIVFCLVLPHLLAVVLCP